MTKAILSIHPKTFGVNILEHFIQGGVIPVFLNSNIYHEISHIDGLENCVFHNNYDDTLGVFPTQLKKLGFNPIVPEPKFLSEILECQQIVLPQLERLNYFNLRTHHLIDYYYKYVANWLGIFAALKPDVMVYYSSPHEGFNFVGYYIANYLGIQTIIAERTMIKDRFFLLNSIYKYPKFDSSYIDNAIDHDEDIGEALDSYLQLQEQRVHNEVVKIQKNALSKLFKLFKSLFKLFLNPYKMSELFRPQFDSVFALTKKQPVMMKHIIYTYVQSYKSKTLRKYYISLCRELNFNEKYIFFPLNVQPERSTSPMGGPYFSNLVYTLDILLSALPSGWKIYLKEHPRQFTRAIIKFSLARDREFYRKISSDPRVIFVDYKYKSEELISHSQCVSVVSGTSGWEAICNGKPVALFGYPWYRECPGIFQVTSIEKLKQYLIDINKGEVLIDIDKVSTYSAWVKNISGHKGSINKNILSSLEYDENSKCISDAFIDMINN